MKPLKRCQTKDGANVLLIDIEDDDDVIVIDSPESAHPKKGESSEMRENQRVSPQSVIRIEDDDENESYMNHLSAHDEEGFSDFECDATSSHRTSCPYDNPHDARSGCYRCGVDKYEYESIEIDSDCEVMEDFSGELREQWERAAYQKKVNRHKAKLGHGGMGTASGSNNGAVRQKKIFSEGPSCSKANANAPFPSVETPSTFNVANEENHVPCDQDSLFPEFDWRNLGGRSSSKKPFSTNTVDWFKDDSSTLFNEFLSENYQSQHNVGGTSFGIVRKDRMEQHCADSWETEGTGLEKVTFESHSTHETNIIQAQCSADNERNASNSHGESFATEHMECSCIFPSVCDCRSRDFDVEKVHMEEQIPSYTPHKVKSNHSEAGFDSNSGDVPNAIPANMECDADCVKNSSKGKVEELEKVSSSETVVRQVSLPQLKGPLVESDSNFAPEGGCSDALVAEGNAGYDIINEKEKLKETEEYKRAMEEEWASRQQQLKLQAEEARRLRKRKKAESLRVSNMEKRQKQRLEEVRASQKQVSANLNMKEQFRSEIIKELKVLELRCFNMASLLQSLGVQVEGGAHPSPQQIHGAYKRAVLKFHPDRTSGSSLKQQVEAEEKFKLISRMKEKFKLL